MPARDDREAAGGRRIDARFVQGDAGVSIGRRALSRVVQGGHVLLATEMPAYTCQRRRAAHRILAERGAQFLTPPVESEWKVAGLLPRPRRPPARDQ
jgi:hypothetical protein